MNPSVLRLFMDEDVSAVFASKLRKLGHDVLTVQTAGRRGYSDDDQLEFAASQGRILITRNYKDFQRIHTATLEEGRHHAGIVICFWRPQPEVMLTRLTSALALHTQDEWIDQLQYA